MATDEEERRRTLEAIRSILNRPDPRPDPRPSPAANDFQPPSWTRLERVLAPIHWDWPGWLPRGFLTILAGDPGAGKSLLALHLAAVYLNGRPWPDGAPFAGAATRVLWCEAESSHALNLQRARNWGLDLDGILAPVQKVLRNFDMNTSANITLLRILAQREDVGLIILDSLRGLRTGRHAPSLRQILTALADIARLVGKPVLLTHHLRKTGSRGRPPAVERLLGPGVIAQTARVIWAVDIPDPTRPELRRLAVIKNNLAPFPDPLGFRIAASGLHFGEPLTLPEPETASQRALTFLRQQLAGGPLPSRTLYARAGAAGLSRSTLRRAKKKLAIRAFRPSGQPLWYWELPEKV